MITAPSPTSVALLLGLSFFLGSRFEHFFAHTDERRPGGIRTFPMLALAGGVLYLFDPNAFYSVHRRPCRVGRLARRLLPRPCREERTDERRAQCRLGRADPQRARLSARRRHFGAAAVDRRDDDGRVGSASHRPRTASRTGAACRNQGDRHRRRISDPDRDRATAVAEPSGHDADRDHAAPGLAGARRGVQLSPM